MAVDRARAWRGHQRDGCRASHKGLACESQGFNDGFKDRIDDGIDDGIAVDRAELGERIDDVIPGHRATIWSVNRKDSMMDSMAESTAESRTGWQWIGRGFDGALDDRVARHCARVRHANRKDSMVHLTMVSTTESSTGPQWIRQALGMRIART